MKKQKKALALLLVLAMTLAVFTGCSGNAAQTTDSAQTQDSAQTTADVTQTQPEDQGQTSQATAPAGDETLAQSIFGTDVNPESWSLPLDDGSNPLTLWVTFPNPLFAICEDGAMDCSIYKEAERITGVHVDITSLSTEQSAERFNIMIASGDYPDMVGWGLNYAGGNDTAVEEGVYMDLSEVIAQYAPNYYNILSNDEELLKAIVTDSGNIIGFNVLQTESTYARSGPQIRVDLLEKVGMDKPYTYDEYHDVLTAFKVELGVEEPLALMSSIAPQNNFLSGGYGVAGSINNFPMSVEPYYQVDGQVKYGIVEDGFKEYIQMIKQWMAEGLISKEFMTENQNQNSPDFSAKVTGGKVGIWYADRNNISAYNKQSEIEGFLAEGTYDAHASSDSVNHFAETVKKSGGNGVILTTQCSNVALAAKWCDWWYTDEGSLLANYGIEGEGFNYDDSGKPVYSDLITHPQGTSMADALLVYASNNTVMCVLDTQRMDSAYSKEELEAVDFWAEGMDDAYTIPITGVTMTTEEQDRYSNIYPDIETCCMENISKFIVGEKSMDEWDAFVDTLWSLGLQEAIDLKQAAVSRYLAK